MNKIQSENLTRRGRGRPKGSLNKTTAAAKDAIAQAATEIGGVDRLVTWIKQDEKNESAFWTSIYPKLLPLQVHGAGEDGSHLTEITFRVVDGNSRN